MRSLRVALLSTVLLFMVSPALGADFCDEYLAKKKPRNGLVVYSKAEQRLCYFSGRKVRFSHRASHGRNDGPKTCQGDGKTPEGRYILSVTRKSGVDFYKELERAAPGFAKGAFAALRRSKGKVPLWPTFMHIGYPHNKQVRHARTHCKNGKAGSAVGIHASAFTYDWLGVAQSLVNHSEGCIVLDGEAMARFEALIKRRTPIIILPDE